MEEALQEIIEFLAQNKMSYAANEVQIASSSKHPPLPNNFLRDQDKGIKI